jgi:hypothetical protein
VRTSMILPFPSSPHCAPIRIVLAIGIRRWAKNFPDASGRTHSGLPTNHMLAVRRCKGFRCRSLVAPTGNQPDHFRGHRTLVALTTSRACDLDHGQRKAQPQFIVQINLNMMQSELLELHPTKIVHVRRVAFHFL